ncbi:MAG: CDP-diacylglycerol--glycerol-3-phosphate 3-phosphatidyltransferase [Planctomycetes bacterium]|nr:CDP-diacylglycerol--glycerol-3-phosphate 3-phosphatidyltransferase [Planctomycetota bacterium]
MNVPNKITTGRLLVTVVLFVYLVATDTCAGSNSWHPIIAGVVFILAVATDALDGYYARKLGQLSDFGRIADPVADKLIVCGTLVFLSVSPWGRTFVPAWMTVTIVGRELLVTALRGYIESRGIPFGARWDGKVKMILQCIALPAMFLWRFVDLRWGGGLAWALDATYWLAMGSIWITFVVTITSGARYVQAAAELLRDGERAV